MWYTLRWRVRQLTVTLSRDTSIVFLAFELVNLSSWISSPLHGYSPTAWWLRKTPSVCLSGLPAMLLFLLNRDSEAC